MVQSVLVYHRKGNREDDDLVIALNLTPVPRPDYRIGLPHTGKWKVILNSDNLNFYGSDAAIQNEIHSEDKAWQGKIFSAPISLPPLAGVILKRVL